MNIRYAFYLYCSLLAFTAKAQSDTGLSAPVIHTYVEQMPKTAYDYQDFLSKHIVYPEYARERSIQGKVITRFVVNEDGHVSDCKVVKSAEASLDREAVRVISKFPPWKPGILNGKAVKVYFTLPIVFTLGGDVKESQAQDALSTKNNNGMPYPGYYLREYLSGNITYPSRAKRMHIQGEVLIDFVVNEDGSISDCVVAKGIGEGCDEEALRVIKDMPPWHPGAKGEKEKMTLPVMFKL